MGTSERREREKSELRDKILKAASDILFNQGFDSLSIRNIASEIEYSPRTIYLYYEDKNHLLEEVIDEGFNHTVRSINRIPKDKRDTGKEYLALIAESYVKSAINNMSHFRAYLHLINSGNYFKPGPNQRFINQKIADSIGLIRADFKKSPASLINMALVIISSLRGLVTGLMMLDGIDQKRAIEQTRIFSNIIINGLEIY